jgi:hypothetical protein
VLRRAHHLLAGATGARALAVAAILGLATGVGAETRCTLARFHDPVIVPAAALGQLPERDTARLRLYRAEGAMLVPIPLQFDARDAKGTYLMPHEGAGPDFVFDDDDELVFMAKDAGHRLSPGHLPVAATAVVEIEVTDPLTLDRCWVYLLGFSATPPAPSPERYVTFDVALQRVRARFYTIDYADARNFLTAMRIAPAAGGSGENLIHRTRMRGNPTFSLLFTRWSPVFSEQDATVRVEGIKNGPVRAIRRVKQWVDLGRFFPDIPSGTVTTHHYFSSFTTPTRFQVPRILLSVLKAFQFEAVSDFRRSVLGMRYWDGANPDGLRFTGDRGVAVETARDHDWWVGSGEAGTFLQAFVIPEEWRRRGVARGTVFRDDPSAVDPDDPEREPGLHAAGYSLLNMTGLREGGEYWLKMATVVLPEPYEPGNEVEPMAMIRHPLRAEVRRVEIVASPPALADVR